MTLNELMNVQEPDLGYDNLIYKKESYDIISCCLEVHNELVPGFSEIIYKDALSIELELNDIPYSREKSFIVNYKTFKLKRQYNCDFIAFDKIILEIKAQKFLTEEDKGQLSNYLSASGCALGLLINFGEPSLKFKRVILSKNLPNKFL